MLWFGSTYHKIEEVNSGEWDNYVLQVDMVRHGQIPADAYRPALYPIVAAGVGEVIGDSFAGARTTSSLFAVLFVLSAFLIGRELFSPGAGLLAMVAMMLNSNVIRYGVHATTDMMFAGLAGLTLFAAVRAVRDARALWIVFLSFCFAVTYFTRYTAIGILPCILVALLQRRRRSVVHVGLFLLCTGIFLVPHFYLTNRAFGSPFHNENWRNLAFKLYGNWDWQYLANNPFHGTMSVIAHDPVRFLAATVRELAKFGVRTMGHLGGYGIAGWLFTGATLVGACWMVRAINRSRVTLLVYLAGYVLMVCAFFYTSPRFMLPVIPMCEVMAGAWLIDGIPGSFPLGSRRVPSSFLIIAVFLIVTTLATVREMPGFVASHPVQELEALEQLEHQYGTGITVVGTAPYFDRHLKCQYRSMKSPEGLSERDFYARLLDTAKDADYVVIGRLTARGYPPGLVDGTAPPAFLTRVDNNQWVTIYRVNRNAIAPGS